MYEAVLQAIDKTYDSSAYFWNNLFSVYTFLTSQQFDLTMMSPWAHMILKMWSQCVGHSELKVQSHRTLTVCSYYGLNIWLRP